MHNNTTHKQKDAHRCAHHEHGNGMGHGSAEEFLKRFWIVTALLIPLVLTHEKVTRLLHLPVVTLGTWVQFGIATVIFSFSFVFFRHALHEIRAHQYGMMTLVSLAVGAGYMFSVLSTFLPSLHENFYLEISTLIWVLLFGHYLEAKSGAAAGDALQEVARLLPKKAHRVDGVEVHDVPVADLQKGDTVLVKPGEKVPADGTIISGASLINEALISGESKPIQKKKGDAVVAGSLCVDGTVTVTLTRVGAHSTVGRIQHLIATAQQTKPRAQQLADSAAGVLTFVAGITALITLVVWTFIIGAPFVFAATLAITVLVIACPHALGLAIPTVTTITTSLAARHGFFIKDLSKIETIRKATCVVFDKTGTLTNGIFTIRRTYTAPDVQEERVLCVAKLLEQHSSHNIAHTIVSATQHIDCDANKVEDFTNIPGKGVSGTVQGVRYYLGNATLMQEKRVRDEVSKNIEHDIEGDTVVHVSDGTRVLGIITLADTPRDSSRIAVQKLHQLGVRVALLTGDNEKVAQRVAKELNIDTYFAHVLPEEKYRHIKTLQDQGNVVIMVGDGINDAPALAQAHVGVAIGAGTDVAVEAGDVVLTRNNPADVATLIVLARRVYKKMVQNLVWALGYNIVAIPMAAGVFVSWGIILRPEVGALIMSLSTVIVVANAMTLKKITL